MGDTAKGCIPFSCINSENKYFFLSLNQKITVPLHPNRIKQTITNG